MVEKISLRLYIILMLMCATTVLMLLWFGSEGESEWFKLIPTFFVLGFANFLIWMTRVVYRFLERG